ncbi:MAG: outer membrane lipoprotein carrier protein LolA [bacterium]|nr:outer membrane lipoprotein carrier protein LolA [bacterium]
MKRIARSLVLLVTGLLAAPAADALSPWELLENLRDDLQKSGPITGKFRQTYIPAGFSDGDHESGHLSIWLPDCLRWNYEEPQAKSFLLCNEEIYFWNEDESGGRHYRIEPEEEPGLDLLLVEVAKLKERYVASNAKLDDGTYEINLALPPDSPRGFSAKIRLEPVSMRVTGMEYTDEEGNLTRFEITDYQRLAHTALFQPPQDVEWTEE